VPVGPCHERRELVLVEALPVLVALPVLEALLVLVEALLVLEALLAFVDEPAGRRLVLAGVAFFPSDTGTLVIVLRPAPPVD
jgi:hypothetical protein